VGLSSAIQERSTPPPLSEIKNHGRGGRRAAVLVHLVHPFSVALPSPLLPEGMTGLFLDYIVCIPEYGGLENANANFALIVH
jgi:hypothetical protein